MSSGLRQSYTAVFTQALQHCSNPKKSKGQITWCAHCFRVAAHRKACSCHQVLYCDKEHQRLNFSLHKRTCTKSCTMCETASVSLPSMPPVKPKHEEGQAEVKAGPCMTLVPEDYFLSVCDECGKRGGTLKCSRCESAKYCSPECKTGTLDLTSAIVACALCTSIYLNCFCIQSLISVFLF